ncbi:ABC transporter substrate-binding protein [Paenibacillus planticolens]|uniref:ABC transporter substrate-binding protein n=1 Tax=Paenibacillus planticolens TaxID=2654976 RepID=A0ABX1ZVW5_9BACL|nr:ABC transporter substrate-binding protein [Paenibacillus planticolens]NOV03838.1 ABC transporter substrate-binding protein [Paenibacillus planticolens]
MSSKWQKRVARLMVISTAIAVVAGCTSKTPAGSEKPADNAPSKELVTLDYLGYDSYGQPDTTAPLVKLVQDKFNVKFNFWFIDANKWDDNLNVKLGAGEMPDVLKVRSQQNLLNYINQGILAPIPRDLIDKYAPTYAKYLDQSYSETWDYVKSDGKIYGIPATIKGYPTVVVWRKDWLDKLGITKVPETLGEFEDAVYKMRNNDPDGNGKKDTYGLSDFAIPAVMGAFGAPPIDDIKAAAKADPKRALMLTKKDGNIQFAATQPEMKDALALLQKWYKDGVIDPEFITSENTSGHWSLSQTMNNNRIGVTGKGQYNHWRNELDPDKSGDAYGPAYQEFKKSQPNGEIVFGKPPVGPQGKSGTTQWGTFNGAIGITTKAAKDPKKLETVLKMMEAATTDYEYYTQTMYGIKGVDWKDDNGKFINLTPTEKQSDSQQKGKAVMNVQVNYDPFLQKQNPFTYKFADKVVNYKGYANQFAPATDTFNKKSSDLGKMVIETYFKIITGEQSVDSFDKFVKDFKANGGDEVEKSLNDAYNKLIGK